MPDVDTDRRFRSGGRRVLIWAAIPFVVVCIALAVPSAADTAAARQEASTAAAAATSARAVLVTTTLVAAVQRERELGITRPSEIRTGFDPRMATARLSTDQAIRSWNAAIGSGASLTGRAVLAAVRTRLAGLGAARRKASIGTEAADFAWYTGLVTAADTFASLSTRKPEDLGAGSAVSLRGMSLATEHLAQEQALIAQLISSRGRPSLQVILPVLTLRAGRTPAQAAVILLNPDAAAALKTISAAEPGRLVERVEQSLLHGGRPDVDPRVWSEQTSVLLNEYMRIVAAAAAVMESDSDRLAAQTRVRAAHSVDLTVAVLIGAVLLGLGLVAFAKRQLREQERRAAQAARHDAARIEAILATVGDAIFAIGEDGVIERANPAVENVFGYQPAELVGQPMTVLMSQPALAGYDGDPARYLILANQELTPNAREAVGRRKDGSEVPVEVHAARVPIGDRVTFISVARDISERHQALVALTRRDVELSQRNEALARSNAELQQFASVASHDLQEPLRKVTSYIEVLDAEYGGQLDEQAKQYMHIASDAAQRMRQLINDLLAISRIREEGMKVVDCDTHALVEALVEDFEITLRDAGGEIEVGELPVIPGDRAYLRQVFHNLLSNAVKYRGTPPLRVQISAVAEPGGWHFIVRDNGIGFEQEHAQQIFGMFQRLVSRKDYAGTGIGLAVVAKVIAHHGGRIWATSAPGVGTTMEFILPPGTAAAGASTGAVKIPRQPAATVEVRDRG